MIITLLCEPRSGSTNLANWFYRHNKLFTVLYNPDIKPEYLNSRNKKFYQNGLHPKDYKYKTNHLIIKEDYYPNRDYSDFISVSDKIICLYRKNEIEQIESWINAKSTENWSDPWVFNNIINDDENNYFKELKKSFKNNFLDQNYFSISYEELYYNNGLQKILDYLNIEELDNKNFPYGQKYRIDVVKRKNII